MAEKEPHTCSHTYGYVAMYKYLREEGERKGEGEREKGRGRERERSKLDLPKNRFKGLRVKVSLKVAAHNVAVAVLNCAVSR